jgi:hypothetical protein
MENLIRILHDGHHSCVIRKNGEVKTYDGKGIRDLFSLLQNHDAALQNADIADKVVGKAAASLMISGGVAHVYTDLLSQAAADFFKKYAVAVTYATLVPFIKRADLTDICPMEALTMDAPTAEEAVRRIREKMSKPINTLIK